MTDYKHMFIKVCSIIGIDRYVKHDHNQSATVDTAERTRDRRYSQTRIRAGYSGCAVKQEAHRSRTIRSNECIRCELRKEDEAGKSCKGERSQERQECNTNTIILYLSSLFFSPNFIYYLQFIDDVCAQINPMLWSMMFK